MGSRQNTERNLAETLKYVDLEDLASSGIFRATKGAHGGRGTIFVGPAGADQMKVLREWALTVAKEKHDKDKEFNRHKTRIADSPTKKRDGKVRPASYAEEDAQEDPEPDAMDGVDPKPPEEVAKKGSPPPRLLKPDPNDAKALALEPDDAFNPEDFNRRLRRQ